MEKEEDWAIQSIQVKKSIPLEEAKDIYKKIVKKKPRKVKEKGEWYRFRVLPPTKFQPKSFRTKVVNDDIHITFGVIKEEHKKMVGGGMWDFFKKTYDYVATKASEAFDYIKKAVSIIDYSESTKKYLQQYGNLPILAIELRRQPLNIALELALQGVSKGKWLELKKKYGFDKFFHLSMLVTVGGAVERKMRNGRTIKEPKKLAIEKLAVVSINENIQIEDDMETQAVNVPKPFTINDMFNKAREKYGDTRFFSYSALGNNNCQNFIKMLLEVEGLYSAEADQFVFQDISQLVAELPEMTKAISQGITHLGALANKYLGIGGRRKMKKDPCWEGYEMVGMKEKDGREVPNCVENNKIGGNNKKMSLDDLYGDIYGGNQSAGYIRALMARDSQNPNVQEKWEANQVKNPRPEDLSPTEGNKKKFGKVKDVKVVKLSKMTHNLLDTRKEITNNQAIKSFYQYVKEHAVAHNPSREIRNGRRINYVGTYDLNDLYERWKQQQGVEVKAERQKQRQEEVVEEELPTNWFELPQPEKPVESEEVVVVPVEDVPKEEKKEEKKDEEDQKVVLGRFENPKDEFQSEINKMVDFAVKYFHFNDLISDVLQSQYNPNKHSSTWSITDVCSMYYYIVQYKIPILDLKETVSVRYYKDLGKRLRTQKSFRSREALVEYEKTLNELTVRTTLKMYNDLGRVVEFAVSTKEGKEHIKMITEQIKLHLNKGEKQIILYFGIGAKGHGHQNLIIIRAVEKKLYIFDPHGTQALKVLEPSYKKQIKVMEMIGKEIGFEVVGSADTCPYIYKDVRKGFQAIENLSGEKYGMCGWWSNFMIELCCLKPDTPLADLYKEASDLLSDKPQVLFNVVMKYQYNLQQIILEISKKAGLKTDSAPIEEVYNSIAVILTQRIEQILEKRKQILGYGNKKAGYIRALMGRDSQNPEVQEKWEANEVKHKRPEGMSSTDANKKKFGNVKEVKVKEMTKTTHNLLDTRRDMTRNQAIKSFYQFIKQNAPPHQPSRSGGINYVGTYDLDDLYDRWIQQQGVEVRAERQRRRQEQPELPELPQLEAPPPQEPYIQTMARRYDTLQKVRGLNKDESRRVLRSFGGNPRHQGRQDYRSVEEVRAEIVQRAQEILRQ